MVEIVHVVGAEMDSDHSSRAEEIPQAEQNHSEPATVPKNSEIVSDEEPMDSPILEQEHNRQHHLRAMQVDRQEEGENPPTVVLFDDIDAESLTSSVPGMNSPLIDLTDIDGDNQGAIVGIPIDGDWERPPEGEILPPPYSPCRDPDPAHSFQGRSEHPSPPAYYANYLAPPGSNEDGGANFHFGDLRWKPGVVLLPAENAGDRPLMLNMLEGNPMTLSIAVFNQEKFRLFARQHCVDLAGVNINDVCYEIFKRKWVLEGTPQDTDKLIWSELRQAVYRGYSNSHLALFAMALFLFRGPLSVPIAIMFCISRLTPEAIRAKLMEILRASH